MTARWIDGGPAAESPERKAWVESQTAALQARSGKRPGREWWMQADSPKGEAELQLCSGHTRLEIDELVIDHWLHLERMSKRDWWMRAGDAVVNVHIRKDGTVHVAVRRGEYGAIDGFTKVNGHTFGEDEP